MRKELVGFLLKYYGPSHELRVRLYNILASFGVIVSVVSAIISFGIGDSPVEYGLYILFAILSAVLIIYSARTGEYQRCYTITVVLIFLIGFPVFYFTGGAYYGALTYFFIFAVLLTIFMLEGKKAVIIPVLELAVYIGISLYARYCFEVKPEYRSQDSIFFESVFGFSIVSIALGISLYLHFRLYNEQQRKLDQQNSLLAEANRSKTEFFANASHEMRTPLTVISVNVQTVADILEEISLPDGEAGELLVSAQGEVMRLARMVSGMLSLSSVSEIADRRETDLSSLLLNAADMLRLSLKRRGNEIEPSVENGLCVFGNADLLVQVLVNLLQNAGTHMENGTVTVTALRNGDTITVTVNDTGPGIDPELLPHVFERGVTTGGTGVGLYLCETVVTSHGGRIWIESEPGFGTSVFYTLPVYAGQYGG